MISAVVAGNLGSDAELKITTGGQAVLSFSVASSLKAKGEESTTWVRCSLWGKRGEALSQYLTKGSAVCVSGGLATREHNGKTYVEMRVDDVKLMGGNKGAPGASSSARGGKAVGDTKPLAANYPDADYGSGDTDDIPF